jgi:hypothetical protein
LRNEAPDLARAAPHSAPCRRHANSNHAIEEFAMTRCQDSLVTPVMFFAAWFGCFAMMVLHFG